MCCYIFLCPTFPHRILQNLYLILTELCIFVCIIYRRKIRAVKYNFASNTLANSKFTEKKISMFEFYMFVYFFTLYVCILLHGIAKFNFKRAHGLFSATTTRQRRRCSNAPPRRFRTPAYL